MVGVKWLNRLVGRDLMVEDEWLRRMVEAERPSQMVEAEMLRLKSRQENLGLKVESNG